MPWNTVEDLSPEEELERRWANSCALTHIQTALEYQRHSEESRERHRALCCFTAAIKRGFVTC